LINRVQRQRTKAKMITSSGLVILFSIKGECKRSGFVRGVLRQPDLSNLSPGIVCRSPGPLNKGGELTNTIKELMLGNVVRRWE